MGGKGGQILSILASLWVWEEILLLKKDKKDKKERRKEKERMKNKLFNNKEFFNFAQNFLIFALDHLRSPSITSLRRMGHQRQKPKNFTQN